MTKNEERLSKLFKELVPDMGVVVKCFCNTYG